MTHYHEQIEDFLNAVIEGREHFPINEVEFQGVLHATSD
jgi:hypothetical protein